MDGYIVDILRGDLIIEVQTANFSAIARKMRALVQRHSVHLVHPIARDRWIVKVPAAGATSRRRSPKHGHVADLFGELVSFPELIGHPNFALDIVIVEEEAVWQPDARRGWRRRGWVTVERRLLRVYETLHLRAAADYMALVPGGMPAEFLTSDLASAMSCPRRLAQQAAYCLRNSGLIEKVGARGNAAIYAPASRP